MDVAGNYLLDYCNELLGEQTTKNKKAKALRKLKKKNKSTNEIHNEEFHELKEPSPVKITDDGFKICSEIPADDSDVSDAFDSDHEDLKEVNPNKESKKKSKSQNCDQTEDGFKIINEIPPDDSDVSDAFDSDYEDLNEVNSNKESKKKSKSQNCDQTEDGFKIINEIPPDDSDVSDAFDSDFDESEWIENAKERIDKTSNEPNIPPNHLSKHNLPHKLKNVKKPLLDLIQDFGMEKKFMVKPKVETNSIINSNKMKVLDNKQLNIMDYSQRRGKKKKLNETCANKTDAPKVTKEDNEAALKKARYEIFKLGTIGVVKTKGDPVERKKAKTELIVKLGAKPDKNKAVNYKKLIEIKKAEKKNEKEKREEEREMGLPVKKAAVKPRERSQIDINPKIGRFKNGVLKLSKMDISTVNSSH